MLRWIIEIEMFELESPRTYISKASICKEELGMPGSHECCRFFTVQKVMAKAQSAVAPALLSPCPCFPIKIIKQSQ